MLRTARKSVLPVVARERAVSIPIPEEVPVITIVFPLSLPTRSSSMSICWAVGRLSPAPLGSLWRSAYLSAEIILRDFELVVWKDRWCGLGFMMLGRFLDVKRETRRIERLFILS